MIDHYQFTFEVQKNNDIKPTGCCICIRITINLLFNDDKMWFHLCLQIAGGLAGETPHMISAAVKGLARLAYEFSDLLSSAYSVLPSSFLLLQRKNREIVKVCPIWP